MKQLKFTPTYINSRGKEAHKVGTLYYHPECGVYCYGFKRLPRKLKKQIKCFIRPLNRMIWVFSVPDAHQLKDPGFMWLECFKTIM